MYHRKLAHAHKDKAYRGDVQATNACLKCCAHLSALHGLYQPSIAVANTRTSNTMIVDARPMSGTDRLEAALNALVADQKAEAAEAAKAAEHDPVAAVPAETSE
jgi:hypothetical protein